MITFDTKTRIFHLQTPNTSYLLGLYGDSVVEHVYWGKRLENITGVSGYAGRWVDFSAYDADTVGKEDVDPLSTNVYPQEYSFFGSTDMRKPAFHARYADGSRITKMRYVSHRIIPGKPKLTGLPATYVEADAEADTLEITLQDALTGLMLVYRYTAFRDYDAISRNVEVLNEGSQPVELKSVMSCNVDFDSNGFEFIDLAGAWGRERHIERRPLLTGTTKIESRRGSSSHFHSPFFALADASATENQGDVYGFSLVYSGNFEAGVEVDTIGQTRAFMGINSFDFSWKLCPGEQFTAPEAVLVYSDKGLGPMSRTYHNLYRQRLARGYWRDKSRPVLINNWEGTYFKFDEEKILNIARCAQKAGVEMMVLDDGWFGARNNSRCALGDWYANLEKLPNGIPGLAEKINALGMKFGLWVEPEMVSPDSDLYRAHPDWCLHIAGRGRSECRSQLVLDLSRADVQEYIIDFMTDILSSAPIAYIKWDMNRNMTCVGSAALPAERQGEVYHRYMLGLYRILETLVNQFPNVLMEGCSGGGGRFDAGQMYYFHQYWTSDNSDAVERMFIQYGTSLVMPSCFMTAHISTVPNHQVGRVTSMHTRACVAMCGQFGYELDVTKMSEEELAEMAEQIKTYKGIQDTVHNGDLYRLRSPFQHNHPSWMYVAKDRSKAVLFAFTLQCHTSQMPYRVQAAGLNPHKQYRLLSTGEIYQGDVLMNYGLYLRQNQDAGADMLVFEEVL